MKKVLFLIMTLALFASCTKDSDNVKLSVSQNELTFPPEESEQIVNITSDAYWDCECNASWLLIRQQENRIRVIAEANATKEPRLAVIKILANGVVQSEIKVTQSGTEISAESYTFTASSKGDTIIVPIQSNVEWAVENQNEWFIAQRSSKQLNLIIERNYKMQERSGVVTLKYGTVSQTITITQSGCEWFESFEMVDVDGGTFNMGAQKNDAEGLNYDVSAYQIESPVHSISLSSFSIAIFEVTQAQWMAAMGNNPSIHKGDNLPVENVTWYEVQEFITLLNEKSGLQAANRSRMGICGSWR